MSNATNKKEVKILMIHGYTQSGPLFRAKTRALEKMLIKALAPYKLAPAMIYPTAPIRLQPHNIPGYQPKGGISGEEEDESDAWAWWLRDDGSGAYRQFDEGMASLAASIDKAGGIDGVLGFSQGGAAAAVLASVLETRERPDNSGWWVDALRAANSYKPLRFAVIYSGFFATPSGLSWLYNPPVHTPTLQYIGSLDTVVEESRSRGLEDRCINPVVLVHPGGHYVPISKEWVMPLVGFVKKYSEDEVETGQ